MAKSLGLPEKPPETGSLPYAPWDNRVKQQLLQLDLAFSSYGKLRTARGARKDELAREARLQRARYLSQQFGYIVESTPDKVLDQMPRDERVKPVDWTAVEAKYVETGSLGASV
jgi:hypothetical protein